MEARTGALGGANGEIEVTQGGGEPPAALLPHDPLVDEAHWLSPELGARKGRNFM